MRANHVSANRFLGLKWFVLAALLAGVVASVYAAGKVRVAPQSSGYVRMGQNADGSTIWGTKTEWAAWFEKQMANGSAVAATEYATTTGAISSSTLGGMARKAIRGGVYGAAVAMAVEGIIDGAGWAIGELKDQVMDPGTKQPLEGEGWCRMQFCAPTTQGITSYIQSQYLQADPPIVRWEFVYDNEDAGRVNGYMANGVHQVMEFVGRRVKPVGGWDGYTNVAPGTDAGPVSDERLGDAIRPHPDVVSSLLTDPRTDRPVMTPELQQQGDKLKQDLEQREGIPSSDPLPLPDLEDDAAKDDGSPWPSFCGWATVVCDFIDWFKDGDGEDVALPEKELEIQPSQWSSGISGGSCPAAEAVTVGVAGVSGDISFDWQPLCTLATSLRPFLIAICMMVAAFIVAGVRKSAA